ncbi:MAG TPA: nucleotide pyrophosphohydrolase, partial [Archaeoglobus veneficus]|nr:nucleotide pyrophosphohydrolase [Archaeoglobus veneficus]
MTIRELQKLIKELYFERDAKRGVEKTTLWLIE